MSAAAVPDPAPPTQRSPLVSINLTVRTMLLVAAIVGLAWAFVYIREAVLTLFLALFVALVLEPVVRLMQRHTRFGRGACATTLVLGLTALSVVFVLLLLSPLAGSFRDFVDALPGMVEDITTNSSFGSWLDAHSSAPETAQANVKEIAQGIAGAAGGVIGVIVTGLQPRARPRHRDLPDAVPDDRPAAADRRRRLAARPARLRPLAPDVGADHHRRLADDARQHRDLDHLRHDLRRLVLDPRHAVPGRDGRDRRACST